MDETMMNMNPAEVEIPAPVTEATSERTEVPGALDPDVLPETDFLSEIEARCEREGLRAVYPDFDAAEALADPVLGGLLRGEQQPTLRQLYEAVHMERLLEARMASAVQARVDETVAQAVAEAVTLAVRESEERLLGHIRARGQRPAENGMSGASGVRMHPAVDRLTRRDRAMLARRAESGETVLL